MQPLSELVSGPKDGRLLTLQANHRLTLLWEGHANGQEVPSVLKCRHRGISLPRGGLDPRITCYINEARFKGLFCVPDIHVDHALITALVERWQQETHTFHLQHREMGITLQDIEVMLGVQWMLSPLLGRQI